MQNTLYATLEHITYVSICFQSALYPMFVFLSNSSCDSCSANQGLCLSTLDGQMALVASADCKSDLLQQEVASVWQWIPHWPVQKDKKY